MSSVLKMAIADTEWKVRSAEHDLRYDLRQRAEKHGPVRARWRTRIRSSVARVALERLRIRELRRALAITLAAEHWHAVITAIPAASPVDVANAEQAIAKAVRGE